MKFERTFRTFAIKAETWLFADMRKPNAKASRTKFCEYQANSKTVKLAKR